MLADHFRGLETVPHCIRKGFARTPHQFLCSVLFSEVFSPKTLPLDTLLFFLKGKLSFRVSGPFLPNLVYVSKEEQ